MWEPSDRAAGIGHLGLQETSDEIIPLHHAKNKSQGCSASWDTRWGLRVDQEEASGETALGRGAVGRRPDGAMRLCRRDPAAVQRSPPSPTEGSLPFPLSASLSCPCRPQAPPARRSTAATTGPAGCTGLRSATGIHAHNPASVGRGGQDSPCPLARPRSSR
jgi:hypothetical protein